jgi:hypothetical protein
MCRFCHFTGLKTIIDLLVNLSLALNLISTTFYFLKEYNLVLGSCIDIG